MAKTARPLRDSSEYEAAKRVVAALEARVKDGSATNEESARYRSGLHAMITYEWCEEGSAEKRSRIAQDEREDLPPIPTGVDGPKPVLLPSTPLTRRMAVLPPVAFDLRDPE